ncbi:hypothetical protein AVEN_215707-1 [Araneus ventricosus]|uniref:Uncharacterized protein n=1 Tax=Araneus ventricosus TaxID=182803 RepID=A0A4Y2FIE9_ARAVE|nr:hypothetical protein AVEN_215707-1 [Araneus ventricosus]
MTTTRIAIVLRHCSQRPDVTKEVRTITGMRGVTRPPTIIVPPGEGRIRLLIRPLLTHVLVLHPGDDFASIYDGRLPSCRTSRRHLPKFVFRQPTQSKPAICC